MQRYIKTCIKKSREKYYGRANCVVPENIHTQLLRISMKQNWKFEEGWEGLNQKGNILGGAIDIFSNHKLLTPTACTTEF